MYAGLLQERCPPCVDDFLYICDDAYTRRDLIKMEMNILKTIDFDIGLPLSYSFLRRYARVSFFFFSLLICIFGLVCIF